MRRTRQPSQPTPMPESPAGADWLRNDLIILATVLVLLLVGWAVARWAQNRSETVELGFGLPVVAYPANWTRGRMEDGVVFLARNPASPGTYSATVAVITRPVLDGETLDTLRTELGFRRNRTLDRYRELAAVPVTVLDGSPAVLTTYASLADPTRDSGLNGLPVVVQGQDLLFRVGKYWVIASTSVDAARAASEEDAFALFLASFGMQMVDSSLPGAPVPVQSAIVDPARAPVAPGATAPSGGFQSQPPGGVNP